MGKKVVIARWGRGGEGEGRGEDSVGPMTAALTSHPVKGGEEGGVGGQGTGEGRGEGGDEGP